MMEPGQVLGLFQYGHICLQHASGGRSPVKQITFKTVPAVPWHLLEVAAQVGWLSVMLGMGCHRCKSNPQAVNRPALVLSHHRLT